VSDFTIYNNIPRVIPAPSGVPAPTEAKGSFGGLLRDAIQQVNALENTSQGELQKFANDQGDLHTVMLALEKADLSFQMMMQVRNKFVQAYQEIMRTQV
jgi:flagellar hook-basal body complex protein FliE